MNSSLPGLPAADSRLPLCGKECQKSDYYSGPLLSHFEPLKLSNRKVFHISWLLFRNFGFNSTHFQKQEIVTLAKTLEDKFFPLGRISNGNRTMGWCSIVFQSK